MSQRGTISDSDDSSSRQVISRLRALREEHPAVTLSTELTQLDETRAVVWAVVTLPSGGSASGFGSAPANLPNAVEAAEDRALDRALEALGYGTADRPTAPDRTPPITVPAVPAPAVHREVAPEEPATIPVAVEPHTTPHAPVAPTEHPSEDDTEPPLEDYSWTAFWQWARKHGYQNKTQVEELIEQSITSLSPAQVRNALRAKTGVD